jgi:hypothetical protein
MAIEVGCFSETKSIVFSGFPCDQPDGTNLFEGGF